MSSYNHSNRNTCHKWIGKRISIVPTLMFALMGCVSKNFVRSGGSGDTISYEQMNEVVQGKSVVVFSMNDSRRHVRSNVFVGSEYTHWTNPVNGMRDSMLTAAISKILVAHHLESALIAGLGGAALGAVAGYVGGFFGESFQPTPDPSKYGKAVVSTALIGGLSGVILGLLVAPWDEYVFN